MKATHSPKYHRNGNYDFKTGYEMQVCTNCGASGRCMRTDFNLECGAVVDGLVCKKCATVSEVNDNRVHVHVGNVCRLATAFDLSPAGASRLYGFNHLVREMALEQIVTTVVGQTAIVTGVNLPIQICNGAGLGHLFNSSAIAEEVR